MKVPIRSRLVLVALLVVTGWYAFMHVNFSLVRKSFISIQVLQQFGTMAYVLREVRGFIDNQLLMQNLATLPKEHIRAFLAERRKNDASFAGSGKKKPNVVILQMESIEANALHAKLDGEYAMDFLRNLSTKTLYFDNAVDQTSAGRTSDAEFLVLTSQVPLRDAPVYTSQDLSNIPSLPRAMNAAGYRTVSLHGFKGAFWNRANNHQRLGFEESYFLEDMKDEERLGWGVSDFATVDRALHFLETSDEPLFLFTVLLTSHHPYDYVRHEFKLEDRGIVHDYLYSIAYVDDAIERFFTGLREKGLAEDTIVIVYGDHDSGVSEGLRNHVVDSVDLPGDAQEIVFMVYGLGENGIVHRPYGLQDLGPTLLNELALPVPGTFIGNHYSVDHPVLLPSNKMITGVSNGLLQLTEAPVDLRHMTLLAIHRPEDLVVGEVQ